MVKVLDIGCGPGIATRQIAAYFQHVAGIDAGESMIAKAKETDCFSATGEQASFSICNSEDIDKHFEPESIDLITIATAAHWFDMPAFYTAAAKVLKPSGTIAMWCGGSWYVDPVTTPNAAAVQAQWDKLEIEILQPFEKRGNRMCRELYRHLIMPWSYPADLELTPEMKAAFEMYDESQSMRREFNVDGKPDPDPMLAEDKGFVKAMRSSFKLAKQVIGTASQVTRWREAHKEELEKGEIEDCVDHMLRRTYEEMEKVPEGKAREWVDVVIAMVLIMVKKKA